MKTIDSYGVVGLIKASFLFEDSIIVQFQNNKIFVRDHGEVFIYENYHKLFPDAMNAMEFKRQHIFNPQLLLKDHEE